MNNWGKRPNSNDRGYGYKHQVLRARWAPKVEAGTVTCARHGQPDFPDCPGLIAAGAPWDLGHDDEDRSKYTGPEHRPCNQLAGIRQGAVNRPREKRKPEKHPGIL